MAGKKFFRGKNFSFNLFNKQIVTHQYNIIGGVLLIIIGSLMVMFKGTFFFQTELPKLIPWSMSFWGYMNEKALESKIFTSTIGNVLGIVITIILAIWIIFYLHKNKMEEEK